MKQASKFEKTAARCWNLLNEGKPFTPIFVFGTMLLYHMTEWGSSVFWNAFFLSLLCIVPLLGLFFKFDFPLFLRNYLWLPVIAYLMVFETYNLGLLLLALGLYFFFTVWFWGSFYYHLRIGVTLWNFKRFWKLVLKNSDSTSGNAQEQMPKFLLLLSFWDLLFRTFVTDQAASFEWGTYGLFLAGLFVYTLILHKNLFDWKPAEYSSYLDSASQSLRPVNDRVITIVIDGMRKERFYEADTPFLDQLRKNGTEYTQMETVYPARTVVCFTSMMTGTYPREHGITSNMVWKLGTKAETVFDSLRKVGKSGRLLGIAHLVDSMGADVDTITAVMNKDEADRNTIERAKEIMEAKNPDFFKVQLIGTDQIGHSRGVLYDEYLEKIAEADRLIEEFVGWLEKKGYMKNTTLIVCADHGQADGIGGHGHLDEGERFVPFFMHGTQIARGKVVEDRHSLVSLASTVTYLLGAPFPEKSRGPVLHEAIEPVQKENVS
ncbi:alkaline phosphatase family protein [Planococcus lenghuensis]|uniref:Sulfatase n=1 Tax=Planococcus lenghuensis TaxID=2213202 RepID=A0A1Q2KZ34_9BACL|nr:alkaline phosphatase family protein [Planococcus lenghuensis]AQQ53451.1 sulfatase [Planococcus lenghuensis]